MQKPQKNSRLRHLWRSLWEKVTPFRLFVAVAALLILIAMIVIALSQPPVDPLEQLSLELIEDRGVLRVGSRGNVPLFSEKKTDSRGNVTWSGLEMDIAGEIAELVLGSSEKVDFVETPFSARNFTLNKDEADCLLCLSPRGYSTAYIYSEPYYTDSVAVVVRMDGPVNLSELHGEPMVDGSGMIVGALTRQPQSSGTVNPLAHQGALTTLRSYNESQSANLIIRSYAGAQDMFADLEAGKLDAVAIETALLTQYFDPNNMRALMQAIGTIDYAVAALPENQSLITAANIVLAEMRADGRLAALLTKYELRDYATLQ